MIQIVMREKMRHICALLLVHCTVKINSVILAITTRNNFMEFNLLMINTIERISTLVRQMYVDEELVPGRP